MQLDVTMLTTGFGRFESSSYSFVTAMKYPFDYGVHSVPSYRGQRVIDESALKIR